MSRKSNFDIIRYYKYAGVLFFVFLIWRRYILQIVTINYYSSNINNLLISLIQIEGCYNLKYFSLHRFHYSFYQILFYLHSAFYAEVSQSVCKPNQITKFCVIPMIQQKQQKYVDNHFYSLSWKNHNKIIKIKICLKSTATSKTWTWVLKNLDPKKPGPWISWILKNLGSENPGPWKT